MSNHSANGIIAVGAPGSEARKTENMNGFLRVYAEELARAIREHPEEYAYSEASIPTVVSRMQAAFAVRSYNKDSRAIKATCKRLGLKCTYKDINAFFDGGEK